MIRPELVATRAGIAGLIGLAGIATLLVCRHDGATTTPPPTTTRVAIRVDCGTECAFVESLALDVWSEERGAQLPLDVVVASDALDRLRAAGVTYQILVPDIDAVARDEARRLRDPTSASTADFFDEFRDYGAIRKRLDELAELAPDRAAVEVIGTSLDNRPIVAIRIGTGATSMMINGTQHAREWIATTTTTCVADRLVREYDTNPAIRAFVDGTRLWVVPVVNPDGYQYSWSDQRYWRKNRRDGHGVDLNRNFAVAFGGAGSSNRERSETYRGPHAFSEPESSALRDLALRERVALHVDFHAYGQLVLYPWGYTKSPAKDRDKFAGIGDRVASAIFAEHQIAYRLMPSAELYPAAGTMTDWMYGDAGALSYTIELRPKGGSGFVLPPSEIRPTCDEGLAAVLALRATAAR